MVRKVPLFLELNRGRVKQLQGKAMEHLKLVASEACLLISSRDYFLTNS